MPVALHVPPVLVQHPKESASAVVTLNLKSHRLADDEAARGERSRLRSRTKAGRAEKKLFP